MGVHARWCSIARRLQHGRPKQSMKVNNIFADKVMKLRGLTFPKRVKFFGVQKVFRRGHIADRGIHPNIKIFVVVTGDLKAKIRFIARNVPVAQIVLQPFVQFF